MQLKAKLLDILPLQTGKGKNGDWKKQDIVVETQEKYPKKVCVSIWGDKLEGVTLKPQELYEISFDIESREFNGRWYTDVRAWKIQREGAAEPQAAPAVDPFMNVSASDAEDDGGDLPF